MKAFEIMDKWFDKTKINGQHLPSNFNHFVILKAINLALDSDQCMSIAKAMWFVYRNIAIFPVALISEFLEHLFSSNFIRLFAHWSFTVRQIFHYFVWYVIDFLFFEVKNKIYDSE